jgi:hypothetical protein
LGFSAVWDVTPSDEKDWGVTGIYLEDWEKTIYITID